jgi:hypothetical protein
MRIDISLNGEQLMQQMKTALLKRLNFTDNIESSEILVADTGPADTIFLVPHKLGKKPRYYIAMLDRAGTVYEMNRFLWTTTELQLKCSVPHANLKLLVL